MKKLPIGIGFNPTVKKARYHTHIDRRMVLDIGYINIYFLSILIIVTFYSNSNVRIIIFYWNACIYYEILMFRYVIETTLLLLVAAPRSRGYAARSASSVTKRACFGFPATKIAVRLLRLSPLLPISLELARVNSLFQWVLFFCSLKNQYAMDGNVQ